MLKLQDLKPSSDWILEDTNEFLLKKCKDATFPLNDKDSLLVNHMVNYIDACYENRWEEYNLKNGIAVAAPQVGCDKKIIYIHFDDENGSEQKYLLANPEIVATSVACCYLKDGEGCLSVGKEHKGHVKRFNKVRVKALDMLSNKTITIDAEGLFSVCLQHEIDHLSGILYYHRIDKKHKYLDNDKSLIAY